MATIVPRQGPKLDQDERVGLLAAQPYDKIEVLGGFGQNPPKWGGGGDTPKMAILGGFPPLPGGSKNPVFGGPGGPREGPKWPFWALPPLSKTDFLVFDPKRRALNASLYPENRPFWPFFGYPPKWGFLGGFGQNPPK